MENTTSKVSVGGNSRNIFGQRGRKEAGCKGAKNGSSKGGTNDDVGCQRPEGNFRLVDEEMKSLPVDMEKFNRSMFDTNLLSVP